MPKGSRHKSHKQSKHSSKDAREYSDSEEESKIRAFSKEESSVKVSRSLGSSEKRKDPPGHSNGDVAEEYVGGSKRRREKEKEKEKGSVSAVPDRWTGGGGSGVAVVERETKGEGLRIDGEKSSKSKGVVDSKSKSSRAHEGGGEKREEIRSENKVESKRKYEKESGRKEAQQGKDLRESKEKTKVVEKEKEKERKAKDFEPEVEDEVVDIGDAITPLVGFGEEQDGRHGRENNAWPIQDERNLESLKDLEKRRRKRDGSIEMDKYQDDIKGSGDRRVSSRGERAKDEKYKDEKHKDGNHGDKQREDGGKDARYKDEEYVEDVDRERRYRDAKYRESSEKVNRHKDDKYREDVDRDKRPRDDKYPEDVDKDKRPRDDKYLENVDRDKRLRDDKYFEDVERDKRLRDDKYFEDVDRDKRPRDDKYRENVDKDKRPRDDKYREGGDRENKYRDAKYRDDADKEYRRRVDKYHEDGDRDDRHRDDWYFEDSSRDGRNRDEKIWEDVGRDGRRRDGKQRDDVVKDKRVRDVKYQDERLVRDGTNDNFDIKRSRDVSEAAEFRHKRSTNRDSSPNFDDRGTRYKDDRGKRRIGDKEDYDDIRSRSTKEKHFDMEKKTVSGGRVESVGNRGRSSIRDADTVISSNHGRRGNSPGYRVLKQEESRYREYMHGGRERREPRDLTPAKEYAGVPGLTENVSRPIEKSIQKDDGLGNDVSTERRLKEDAPISPFQMVDKSPSSLSNDRRILSRADVRRSLDVEDSGQRSSGSKEIKDYHGRDNRGNRELPIENLPGDDIPQADTDKKSISSPFGKPNYFNNNSRSQLPPTPFRGGPDRPFEDENRGKQIRRRRMDTNIGRPHGNAWRGVPNWPSPVTNGFVPFQHGPPPLGFHPVMQQFPTNPIFGVRPSMELNQSGVPFHVHDNDRFPGHVRPLGWDGNNSIFGDESHLYGRLDWDHNRSLSGARGWENSRDVWKGQNSGLNTDITSVRNKDDLSTHEDWAGNSAARAQNDKKQTSDVDHSSDVVESDPYNEASKAILEDISDLETKDDDYFSRAYLSMLDISEDLSQYELYSEYTTLVGMGQNADTVEDDSRLVIMEDDINALGKDSYKTSSTSLFSTMSDSIFQRAMSLYKKINEEAMPAEQDKVPSTVAALTEYVSPVGPVEAPSNDEQMMELIPTTEAKEPEIDVPDLIKVKIEDASFDTIKTDQVKTDVGERSDEPGATLNVGKMKIDSVVVKEEMVEDGPFSPKEVNNGNEGADLTDGKSVLLPFSGASAEVEIQGVIESGSVNLSRIHQSPESTH